MQYNNNELKPLNDAYLNGEKSFKEVFIDLDKQITNLKQWMPSTWQYIYLLIYHDDNNCDYIHEIITDSKRAHERFFEAMKYYFSYELKQIGMPENFNWSDVSEFSKWWFHITSDWFKSYYDREASKWNYSDNPKYPRYTLWVWLDDCYTELILKKIKINQEVLSIKDDKNE